MNEAQTRAELIDPKLRACGWGVVDGSQILREEKARITDGKIQTSGGRGKGLTADYILVYKGIKLAVVEAKSDELDVGEGVMQAKLYAEKLQLETTYSTNGKEIYQICMKTGVEGLVEDFLSPDALWQKTFSEQNEWRERFANVPFEDKSGSWQLRYYQEIAVQRTVEAIAQNKDRILLTLATGTGKTAIAFQIAWKLFQTRWNLKRDGNRRPRILFLADRNVLADQAYNSFSAFPDDALVRIKPNEIKKNGKVPTNGSIFFSIFQTFMSGTDAEGKPAPYFGEYPADYFDLIVIDECHRGGANDEGNWRGILEYFSSAVQLGLTATPKRADNVDTYQYFGEPVYVYSLKDGINDGFLTPFKVKRIKTSFADGYTYTGDDEVIEGEVAQGQEFKQTEYNKALFIEAYEQYNIKVLLEEINQKEKTIIFCASQQHAAYVRDLINQNAKDKNPLYCVRVTAHDGEQGEQYLREFQDNEKSIPTILTTSQKLSTGVDARNVRNVVLLRPVGSMIEFKQIVGRGTRLFDGKDFFTIYDFFDNYKHFKDKEWDGEPEEQSEDGHLQTKKQIDSLSSQKPKEEKERQQAIKIKLRSGKVFELKHFVTTAFLNSEGNPISAEEFLQNIYGQLPQFFKDEHELRELWSQPATRKAFLDKLKDEGYSKEVLSELQRLVNMEKSDLYDVLEYVYRHFDYDAPTREKRAKAAEVTMFSVLNDNQKEFILFVLSQYVETGVDELDQEKLPILLANKYQSLEDAKTILGDVANISRLFVDFQKHLYQEVVA
ncbi:type I restriction endonuclease subunit R [Formosimonas limnophila]|uniref:Type I restriction endonuclease subunit R n=1 Tax=Formosimonas limnophila TaxID=1384487 RepID=A0A8J3FYF4_9BURK|nr:type I restriction endonuclease subunit R [Formosimonas limnophila]GHA65390.1 type I restriction endonuclease subunit R [Formosimonas limnophila]